MTSIDDVSVQGPTLLYLAMPSMHQLAGDWAAWIEADARRATAYLDRQAVADLLAGVHATARTHGHDLRWVAWTFHDLLYTLVARTGPEARQ